MKKKLLSSILSLIMVLSLLPVSALAENEAWQEVSDGASLTQALQSGGNIRVAGPVEVTSAETLEITKPVVLDLNGQTVNWSSSAKDVITIQKGGDLTIQDPSDRGVWNFTSTYSSTSNYGIRVYTDGSLTLTGGTISYYRAAKSGGAIYTGSNAEFTMTGGTVSISGACNYAMYLSSSGLHQMTGGKIAFDKDTLASTVYGVYAMILSSSDPAGFHLSGLTVDGSDIPDSKTVICVRGYNSSTPITISSGTYTANGNKSSYAVGAGSSNKTSISGGTFNGAVKAAVGNITGGTFSVRPPASYLALGKIYEEQDDGYYHVVDGTYVAYVGDTGYLTWDDLFAAIPDETSASIYILSDAAEITVPEGKNVVFYNSKKCSIDKITNNGTCKVITYALSGTELVNNGTLSLNHEVGSLVNHAGGVVNATADSPKVTGALTNHGTMTITKGSYLGTMTNDGTLTITGGTFARDVQDLCAEGYTTQQNKEGTWDVMADVPHVAEIDGYWYGTLQAAVSAAKSGDTVKLLSDITLGTKVSVSNKTLTLDMNGHKITYAASGNNYGAMVFMGASDITITGNGSFDFDDTYASESSKSTGRIFDVENSAVLTIENGTFYAGLTCVLADNSAKVIILGGTYSASQPYYGNWFLLNLQDNTAAQILVYGGTFANYDPSDSHTENPAANFCAEGYLATSSEQDGTTYYTVGPDSTQSFVARIGDRAFVSLASAVKTAGSGDTIELLSDIVLDTPVSIDGNNNYALLVDKSVTIDGTANDGSLYTITVSTERGIGVQGADDAIDVTFRNLNIVQTTGRSSIETRGNTSALTLDHVNLNASASTASSSRGNTQVLTIGGDQDSAAKVVISNSTITSNQAGYCVITFNPVDMEISGSTLTGWAPLYFKAPTDSAGSAGSTVTVKGDSVLNSQNQTNIDDDQNQFGAIVFEDNNVSVFLQDAELHVSSQKPSAQQAAISFALYGGTGASLVTGNTVTLEAGASVAIHGDQSVFTNSAAENEIAITGGTFNFSPSEYVAAGYIAKRDGTDTYTYTVLEKANLTDGIYMNDPTGATAANYYVTDNNDGTWTVYYSAPSGGGSSSGSATTETVTNPDGSITTTVTKPNGTVTESTEYTDGSTQVVETKPDGTTTTTQTDPDGNKAETVENPDGTAVTNVEMTDGSTSTTTVDENGQVEAQVALHQDVVSAAQESGEAVALPIPAMTAASDADSAPVVVLDLASEDAAILVEIPVENVTPGVVAVRMLPDGTQQVISTTLTTENGVAVTLSHGDTVKIVDNSKDFIDVPDDHWGAGDVDFVTSRELFNGTSEITFTPAGDMTRAMMVTVLARYSGVDTSTGDTWYEAGAAWAVETGVSDGTSLDAPISREQLVTMLWRLTGSPACAGDLSAFPDAGSVSDWALDAMNWAVETGIITGTGFGTLNPQGTASRVEVATILARFVTVTN